MTVRFVLKRTQTNSGRLSWSSRLEGYPILTKLTKNYKFQIVFSVPISMFGVVLLEGPCPALDEHQRKGA